MHPRRLSVHGSIRGSHIWILGRLAARVASLRDERGKLDAQIATVSKQDPERWSLERAVDAARAEAKQIAARLDQARLFDAMNENLVGTIAIMQARRCRMREPTRPRWSLNPGLGLAIGLMLSVVLAVLSELRAAFARRSTLS